MGTKKLLLVEGVDDEHVFKAIFGQYMLAHLDEIKQHGGYSSLIEALPLRLVESDVTVLGVVVDADTNLSSRWESIRHRLVAAGYQDVPAAPAAEGLVLTAPTDSLLPKFGVWIMPDNTLPGILEHFLETLIPDGDNLFAYTVKCVGEIPAGTRLFRDLDIPKAQIHTWLAWQDEPGKPLGQSITRKVLRADSPSCHLIVEWLKRLYFTP